MRKAKMIKRIFAILICVALLVCVGCAETGKKSYKPPFIEEQWGNEKGFVVRDDLTFADFTFLYEEWDYQPGMTDKELGLAMLDALRKDIEPDDIFAVLGLPYITQEGTSKTNYTYLIGDQFDAIEILYKTGEGIINVDLGFRSITTEEESNNLLALWATGDRPSDEDQYTMDKRFDIGEEETKFIDVETTSADIQKAFGAPNYYVRLKKPGEEELYTNIMVYELTSGNELHIAYFRQGTVKVVWVEDEAGNTIRMMVERDNASFYEERD